MLECFIGLRRVGKSTLATKIAKKYQRRGIPVFSNFEIDGCYLIDSNDLGRYQLEDCCLILDEIGIDFNNRKYKDMSQDFIKWLKLSGHYGVNDIFVFSQAFDFDVTIRRLCDKMHTLHKIGQLTFSIGWQPQFIENEIDGQPMIKWKKMTLSHICFRPLYYKYFDSYVCEPLPYKKFKKYVVEVPPIAIRILKKMFKEYTIDTYNEIVLKRLKEKDLSLQAQKEYDYLNGIYQSLKEKESK